MGLPQGDAYRQDLAIGHNTAAEARTLIRHSTYGGLATKKGGVV